MGLLPVGSASALAQSAQIGIATAQLLPAISITRPAFGRRERAVLLATGAVIPLFYNGRRDREIAHTLPATLGGSWVRHFYCLADRLCCL